MKAPPQELCLSEVELEKLLNGTHTLEKLTKIITFARSSTCQVTQCHRIISMLYDKLDRINIPHYTIDPVSGVATVSNIVEDLDFAFAALMGLGTTIRLWLNKLSQQDFWQQLARGLCTHWPDIRQWVVFMYHNIIVQEVLDISIRQICKNAILDFLALVRDNRLRVWSRTIPTDREVMKIIYEMWSLEIQDPRFSSWNDNQRGSPIFSTCLFMTCERGASVDWESILGVFQGNLESLARVSVGHLERELSRGNELNPSCISYDLQIITVLSQRENIRFALMRQGMIKVAAELLASVVDHEWEEDMQMLVRRCVADIGSLLKSRVEEMDGLPFLTQALEHGLVSSLLKCEPFLTSVGYPVALQELLLLLGETLPGYSVYRSVLYQLTLAVDSAIGQGLDVKLAKHGGFCIAWKRLKDTVDERRKLVKREISSEHVQTCQNDVCSKTSRIGRFKRCGGCLHAYYCSWECQRHDWQNGSHKQYCIGIQQRFIRSQEEMSHVHSKDLKFLDQLILAELRKHRAKLDARPLKPALVELSFLIGGQVDIFFDARGAKANPFGTECECESYSNTQWKRMAEVVKEGKKPMVLVRVFIPGGMSRKIILQAIPLAVVMHQRGYGQEVGKCQFNLIFTCCGSKKRDQPVSATSRGFTDVKEPKIDY